MADALQIRITVPRRRLRVAADLEVGPETLVLVGPSGAGKSTVLRAVAGLERPREGRIAVGGDVWFDAERRVNLPPERRSVGLVFQQYALFPHMSVLGNVRFGGRAGAEALLERLGIAHLASARPGEISGGERQRVALARALARRPRVLLLDEPMAALDPHTRDRVRAELRATLGELGLPTVIVSHDFEDAVALGTRVAVMDAGEVVQTGTARELVDAPASPFVEALVRRHRPGAGLHGPEDPA
ncbi:MAG: ATP-binding cassette domain-containing protein [Thermoleophilia bacterium]